MTFGEKLQRLRKARGWTQEQLAEQVSVSRQSLSKWESDAALPDTANVIVLSDLFGVSTDYLLREGEAEMPASMQPAARRAFHVDKRKLGGYLCLGTGLVTLFVLRMLASLYPCVVEIDYGAIRYVYEGFQGYIIHHDFEWLACLCLIDVAVGVLVLFGPAIKAKWEAWCKKAEQPDDAEDDDA